VEVDSWPRFATLFIDEPRYEYQAQVAGGWAVPFCLWSRHNLENLKKQIAQLNLDAVSEQAANLNPMKLWRLHLCMLMIDVSPGLLSLGISSQPPCFIAHLSRS
jgi:hypothetical protein